MGRPKVEARFIEPMLLLRTEKLPSGAAWMYEIKLDGYRALAIKTGGAVQLRSRNNNDFSQRYGSVARALAKLPAETVVDGEIVAFDEAGKPSFNILQNHGTAAVNVVFFLFDILVIGGRDVTLEPFSARRQMLEKQVLPKLKEPIRYSSELRASLTNLVASVKEQGLEGLVAKRRDSKYEPGERSGAWQKMRVNRGQEFVIGGYTPSDRNFDALVIGYYEKGTLLYAGRTRNGFTPALRANLFKQFHGLESSECPFANLPEKKPRRWGQGLTAAKMKECRWLRPVLVGQFEFVEWTPDRHLRHTRFIGLRTDRKAREVVREA
jgi:DNA ligase D-like protein (predicted ligase)